MNVQQVPTEGTLAHRDVNGGWLRPAVFGAMDGLVSNFALIAGVAGSGQSSEVIMITGLAGLAAGAFSMAAGEWVSVASEKEMILAEIEKERQQHLQDPAGEKAELAELYIRRGVTADLAYKVAKQISENPEHALEIHIREELGVDPSELSKPGTAAISSFLCFAVGASIPLAPYLLGATTLWPAIIFTLMGLFICGALVSTVTTRSWLYSGIRQVLIGATAAALTYLIGSLVGVSL